MEYFVEIVNVATREVVKRMGPMPERQAERVELGASINLNHDEYYTRSWRWEAMSNNTPEYVWQSSVLRTTDDDLGGILWMFVNGDRSPVVMLEVIKLLDSVLAIREIALRVKAESMIERDNDE